MITEIQTQSLKPAAKRKRGFTLTEIAIVLGIIGLILGAIWGAASAVYSNKKISDAEQGITATAGAVRALFAASMNTGGAATAGSITTAGMLPMSWSSSTAGVYGNPWNVNPSTSYAYVTAISTSPTIFGVELDAISPQGCAALANYFGSASSGSNGGQITGLTGLVITTGAVTGGTPKVASLATTYSAATTCSNTASQNSVSVNFDMSKM